MRRDFLLAILAGSIAGIVYALGSASGVLFGDGGELQFAAWTAGLPHPTGYPLYIILGWAWTHLLDALGLASPARAMTLLSVFFAAASVALTYLLARALIDLSLPQAPISHQRLAALLAALTFAFTPTFWSQAVVTEVYTLHAALVALVLGLALAWRREAESGKGRAGSPQGRLEGGAAGAWSQKPDPLLGALALAFGFGLAHHRTTLLLAPFVLGFLVLQAPAGYWRRQRRTIPWLFVLTLAPLLLYLYVPLRAGATPYLTIELRPGQPVSLLDRSPGGLIEYLLGRGFAGELQSLSATLAAAPGLLQRLLAELTALGTGLALLGLGVLVARRRWALLWLTGGSLLALAGFNLFYTIGDIGVFYIPCYLIACGWIGVAAAWLASQVARLAPRPAAGVALAALFILPIALCARHFAALDRSQDTRAQDWWNALLAANPPHGAMLISNDRDEMMPLWYLQQVEGIRPDLVGAFPLLLPDAGWENLGRVVDSALATGRPVSLVKPMPGLEVKAQPGAPDPSGLTPVLGPATAEPPAHPQDALLGDSVRLTGVTVDPASFRPGQSVLIDLYWRPERALPANTTSFVQLLLPDGGKVAQSDHLVGGVYYPSSLWRTGETLRDRHALDVPADAPAGPYQLLVGLYELVDGEARTLGSVTLDQ